MQISANLELSIALDGGVILSIVPDMTTGKFLKLGLTLPGQPVAYNELTAENAQVLLRALMSISQARTALVSLEA